MALSRSLLWVPLSICCLPTVIERPRIHLLRCHNPKQNAGIFWAEPWDPRGWRSRIVGEQAHRVLSIQAKQAQGQVEALPPNVPNGEEVVPKEKVARKSPRSRRRPRRKAGEETSSSSVVQKGDGKDFLAAEVPKSGRLGITLKSNSGDVVVDPSLELGVIRRDNGDAATARKSLHVLTSEYVPEFQVASNAGNQGSEETRKKKKRSKTSKEAKTVSNGRVNSTTGVDTKVQAEGGVFKGDGSTSEGRTPSHGVPEVVGSSKEGHVGLETTLTITGAASEIIEGKGEESGGSQVSIKKKKRAKKKPTIDQGKRQANKQLSSSGRGGDVPVIENLARNGSGSAAGEEQSGPQGNNGQGIPKTRKRRGRRKTVGTLERVSHSSEQGKNVPKDTEEGSEDLKLGSHSSQRFVCHKLQDNGSQKVPMPKRLGLETSSKLPMLAGDEVNSTKGEDSKGYDCEERTTPFVTRHNRQASNPKGESGDGTIGLDSIEDQKKIPAAVSEGEASKDETNDRAKPVRRGRKKKARKKRVMETQSEQVVSGGNDLFDSIIWCTVHMKVQTELQHNEHLYVVGANPELGGWDLSMALPLPESEEEGIRENTLKIPRGTMLEYKYFAEARDPDSAVIERWFGPEIQYFLPWKEGQGSEVEVIRDTWIPDIPLKLPLLSWGDRWWEEVDTMDDEDVGGYNGKDLDQEDQHINSTEVVNAEDEPLDMAEWRGETATEEPGMRPEEWLKRRIRKKVFPREEPWLLESMIMEQRNAGFRKVKDADANGQEIEGGADAFEGEQKEQLVQVEILINSPQCTMQRMAILEDGKLVELLLEPVNTQVQVGNVYLGVVRQLLPGMTGVFVDIGGFQLALLDITRNQYPYTFPGIDQSTDVSGDGQLLDDEEDSDWEGEELEDDDEDEDEDEDEDDDDDEDDDNHVDDEEEEGGEVDEEEEVEDDTSRGRSIRAKVQGHEGGTEDEEASNSQIESRGRSVHPMTITDSGSPVPITVNFGRKLKKWRRLQEGMQIIVQVKKEALGKKGPRLTAFPSLAGRFWVLVPGGNAVGVSRRITGPERKRLRQLAQELLPPNFALTVRTEALGHDREDLQKDLARLLETWKEVLERASAAAVAAEHGMDGTEPVLLHRAMGQTLTLVRDFFTDKVQRMVIDSPQCYQEVTSYLQEVAPQLSDRVELYTDKMPIFDAFDIESEIEKFSSKRVSLPNGGYLVMEETEALVSIDVNGGIGVLSHDVSQEDAILGVNLAAARQIAIQLRLRDIGGIIVVDFIDMDDPKNEKLVLDEMRKATSRDRSNPTLSEISDFGLMEMTRKRVRPSVTLTISDPCSHCGGVGRVEAHEATLSKIERAILRLLATRHGHKNLLGTGKWPQLILRVDTVMAEYLKGRKRKRMTQLSAALKVWLNLKVALEFNMGQFQVLEQHRSGNDKRPNVSGQTKWSQQNIGPGLLGKRAGWPGKRRRNFANQVSNKVP